MKKQVRRYTVMKPKKITEKSAMKMYDKMDEYVSVGMEETIEMTRIVGMSINFNPGNLFTISELASFMDCNFGSFLKVSYNKHGISLTYEEEEYGDITEHSFFEDIIHFISDLKIREIITDVEIIMDISFW